MAAAAAAAASLLSAAARRISRSGVGVGGQLLRRSAAARLMSSSSSSSIVTREVTGHHDLRISGYAATRKAPVEWVASSQAFDAAGYRWRIKYDPNGNSWISESSECISVFVELADHDASGRPQRQEVKDPVQFKLSLLDRSGNPSPRYSRSNDARFFVDGQARFEDFIRWKDLEDSGCLNDDSFIVRCDITVIEKWAEGDHDDGDGDGDGNGKSSRRVVVPPSNLHKDLYEMLWKKKGTDVAIDVGGETFEAHRWLLAARSPAFEAEVLKAASGGSLRRRVEVGGMEPKVFKGLLHFMYTDALPPPSKTKVEEDGGDEVAMAQGLLAAAHRYKLERLKLMCEDTLCRSVGLDTVAATMAVAEKHGCGALEAACAEFLARPGNLKAVMETEGYDKIKANPAMMELIMKQLA